MKFTMTTLLAAALATVSFAQYDSKPLPAQYSLNFTSISTGAFVGSVVINKVYDLRIDPAVTKLTALTATSATSGGAKFPPPLAEIFGIQLMRRVHDWGFVVLTNDDWDDVSPKDFLWIGDNLYYDDDDGKGLQSAWYACDDNNPNPPRLGWYFVDVDPKNCFLVSVQVVAL